MRVLIVEDEIVAQELLKGFMERYDAICHVAMNGVEGVEAFKKALADDIPYDLVLLDIMMPEMDGQEALQEIRRLEADKGVGGTDMVKVAMVTALSDPKNIMEALIKGSCEAYLTKPIVIEKLHKVLLDFDLVDENEGQKNKR